MFTGQFNSSMTELYLFLVLTQITVTVHCFFHCVSSMFCLDGFALFIFKLCCCVFLVTFVPYTHSGHSFSIKNWEEKGLRDHRQPSLSHYSCTKCRYPNLQLYMREGQCFNVSF